MVYVLFAICLVNLLFTILIGLNIIRIREIVQGFVEEFPLSKDEEKGLVDVETSQLSYSSEPLIDEE